MGAQAGWLARPRGVAGRRIPGHPRRDYLLYIPWLDFPRAFEPLLTAASGKAWMYSNWAPDLVALTISDQWLDPAD